MARKAKIVRNQQQLKYKNRYRNRCALCGRSRGYLRDFDMCRICFRSLANKGEIPGVTKSSW
jgi:small subunit ribosomal protein S14